MDRLRLLLAAVLLPAALLGAAGDGHPAGHGTGLSAVRYAVAPGSRFRIDGTSTAGAWSCAASEVAGAADVPEGGAAVTAEVTVSLGSFDCGVARMNRDFRDALGAAAHPTIRFALDRAELLATEERPGAWVPVRAIGRLRLAGVERTVAIAAEGRRLGDGRVRLRGTHPMRMTTFGVTPPSGMLGLVRARDAVVVAFDLTAATR